MKHVIDPIFQTTLDAAQEMHVLCETIPRLNSWKVHEVLRLSPGMDVFAMLNAKKRRKIIHRYKGPKAAAHVAEVQKEYKTVSGLMSDDRHKSAICDFALPDFGIVVLGFPRGQILTDLISRAEIDKRQRLLKRAGIWLDKYVGGRTETGEFYPRFWIKAVEKLPPPKLRGALTALDEALLHKMNMVEHVLQKYPLTKAAVYHKFTSDHLIFRNSVLTSSELSHTTWQPLARACAQFLFFHAQNVKPVTANTRFGIDEGDLEAFFRSRVLPIDEQGHLLTFFMCEHALRTLRSDHINNHGSNDKIVMLAHAILAA